jgi:hypothetical protein
MKNTKYAFGSRRKNSYKNKTIKNLKAMLAKRGLSSAGMMNRRDIENTLNRRNNTRNV